MLKGTINFTGRTLEDVQEAVNEASKHIATGSRCGTDSNDSSFFAFDVHGEEDHVRCPYCGESKDVRAVMGGTVTDEERQTHSVTEYQCHGEECDRSFWL